MYLLQSCLNVYKNAKMREHFFYFLPKFTKPVASFLFALQAGFVFVVYDLVKRVTQKRTTENASLFTFFGEAL